MVSRPCYTAMAAVLQSKYSLLPSCHSTLCPFDPHDDSHVDECTRPTHPLAPCHERAPREDVGSCRAGAIQPRSIEWELDLSLPVAAQIGDLSGKLRQPSPATPQPAGCSGQSVLQRSALVSSDMARFTLSGNAQQFPGEHRELSFLHVVDSAELLRYPLSLPCFTNAGFGIYLGQSHPAF
jgi:hypothetical protein